MKKKKTETDLSGYKTEEVLKEEAKARAAAAAKAPPPSPGRKKAENFWYHYKWATLGGAVALCLAALLLRDLFFRTSPDATIIVVTQEFLHTDEITALETALGEILPDRNGDGKQVAVVDYINLPANEQEANAPETQDQVPNLGGQMDYASVMKLTTVMAAGMDPLFLVDDSTYDYLSGMAGEDGAGGLFSPLDGIPGALGDRLPLSATLLAENPALDRQMDLTFCLREKPGASDKETAYLAYCRELLLLLTA